MGEQLSVERRPSAPTARQHPRNTCEVWCRFGAGLLSLLSLLGAVMCRQRPAPMPCPAASPSPPPPPPRSVQSPKQTCGAVWGSTYRRHRARVVRLWCYWVLLVVCGGCGSVGGLAAGGVKARRVPTSGRLAALRRHALGGGQGDDPGSVTQPWGAQDESGLREGGEERNQRSLAAWVWVEGKGVMRWRRVWDGDGTQEWDGDGTGGAADGPSRPPCSCPTPWSSGGAQGGASTLQLLPGRQRSPHVLTSTANSTGPFVLPSHHLLHERSQLRLPLVGEICSTNRTSAPSLHAAGPTLLCSPSVRRGRGMERTQRQAGQHGAAPGATKQEPQHNSTQRPQHQQLCPSSYAPAALPQRYAGTLDRVKHPVLLQTPAPSLCDHNSLSSCSKEPPAGCSHDPFGLSAAMMRWDGRDWQRMIMEHGQSCSDSTGHNTYHSILRQTPRSCLGARAWLRGLLHPSSPPPGSGFNLELPDVGPTGSPNPIPTSGLREVLHRADSITDVGPSSSDSGMHRTPGVPGQEPPAAPEPIPLTCTAHVSRGEATERVTPAGVGVVGHGIDDSLQVFLLLQTGGVRLRGAWGKAGSVTAPPGQGEEMGHCSRMG